MRLSFIEACGFRGFREPIRIDIPRGFAVISGRIGVGKSSIFDAVEFALTGSLEKYRVGRSAQEKLSDYFWWRGSGTPPGHFVSVGFVDGDGEPFIVKRTRENGLVGFTERELSSRFCIDESAPASALSQLCLTSIIRDEWIAALSLDQTEIERFEFVSGAIGSVDATAIAARSKAMLESAKVSESDARLEYTRQRERVASGLEDLARINDAVLHAGDVASAIVQLEDSFASLPAEYSDRVTYVRSMLAARRQDLAGIRVLIDDIEKALQRRGEIEDPVWLSELREAEQQLALNHKSQIDINAAISERRSALDRAREADAMATMLSSLLALGARHALVDGHCALCDTELSLAEFEIGVRSAQARLTLVSSNAIAEENIITELLTISRQLGEEERQLIARIEAKRTARAEVKVREAAVVRRLLDLGVEGGLDEAHQALKQKFTSEASAASDLEAALQTLELSRTASMLGEVEERLQKSRADASAAEGRLARVDRALQVCRQIDHALKRTVNEVIDERLASISPLLTELYQRLRPHVDWRTLEYRLRGDVKKYLRLSVGDELNPQFLFSSGQRRTAGLAFLLAVHLARRWTNLRSLMLDDPVQHVDDYRAMNLVEVLSALRRDDRQIVCAVEDDDLADLLCRRLRSSFDSPGVRYQVGLSNAGTPRIVTREPIEPFVSHVMEERRTSLEG